VFASKRDLVDELTDAVVFSFGIFGSQSKQIVCLQH
jgi:hypothetical protein